MGFNKTIRPNENSSTDHSATVLEMMDQDFDSYLIFGYLKNGERVLMSRGKESAGGDSVSMGLNVLLNHLSDASEEN